MAEYIDREAAIKAMENADCALIADNAESCKADYLREIIKSVPAADVVPVVLCKDCRYAVAAWGDVYACTKPHRLVSGNHFCGFGARMDGGAGNV